jgi:protein-tyrosine phosphatase
LYSINAGLADCQRCFHFPYKFRIKGRKIMTQLRPALRHWPLAGTYNLRDIGGYATQEGGMTRWRTFLRADALHKLTPAAQQALIDSGVRTIIDLRHDEELATAPNVFANSDQVTYHNLPLFAGASPNGNRTMPPDLETIYRHVLDDRQAAIKAVFDAMTATDAFPVLIHCTAGKDRTGVIAALMLGLAGVHAETIAEDYALTAHYAEGLFVELRTAAAAAGRDLAVFERYLESKPEAMINTLAYLAEKYESVPAYLKQIGLTAAQIDRLRQQLLDQDAL